MSEFKRGDKVSAQVNFRGETIWENASYVMLLNNGLHSVILDIGGRQHVEVVKHREPKPESQAMTEFMRGLLELDNWRNDAKTAIDAEYEVRLKALHEKSKEMES